MQSVAGAAMGFAYPSLYAQQAKPPAAPPQKYSLTGIDSSGKLVKLDDYAGKVCLVSFFTSGCNLCSNDLKLMREFYAANKARNFVLLGVNVDDSKNDFMQYMDVIALSVPAAQRFPIVWRNAPVHKDSFGAITKKPTHFVLDKTHKLAVRREGVFQPDDWDELWSNLS
jgi:peroxiredoxin